MDIVSLTLGKNFKTKTRMYVNLNNNYFGYYTWYILVIDFLCPRGK